MIILNSARDLWRRAVMRYEILADFMYDLRSYLKYNGFQKNNDLRAVEGRMIAHYHVLEKGFSFPSVKPCFALGVVGDLLNLVAIYQKDGDTSNPMYQAVIDSLTKYDELNRHLDCYPKALAVRIGSICGERSSLESGGSIAFTRSEFFKYSSEPFDKLALSRYSVRDFSDEPVNIDTVYACIEVARKTPSVCNRQAALCYVFTDPEEIKSCLALQQGNRGFGEKIKCLIAVAYDIRLFEGNRERNQGFVDGGMFSMSLLYALHWGNLGAVPLNWSYSGAQNRSLEETGLIKQHHRVVMFIGIGIPADSFKVPISKRRSVADIIENR
jgi:nitroreductase